MQVGFLTYHGTCLCFGDGGDDFRHRRLDQLDDIALVLADADPVSLRNGHGDGGPVSIRPSSPARIGLPRALGIGRGKGAGTVSLGWRDAHLCAGGEGGTILRSDRVDAWEEFLPLALDDLFLLRALLEGGWESARDRRRFGRGEVRPEPDFMLRAGDLAIDLRLVPSLGGRDALDRGRASLLVEGWRIETLRQYEPLVVWRHDGSEHADEEIVIGLRSMVDQGGVTGRILVETRLARPALLEQVPALSRQELEIRRPNDDRRGLLPWTPPGEGSQPVLYLANGVACCGTIEPLVRTLAEERDVAVLPWLWSPERAPQGEVGASFFFNDPSEARDALACSAAIIGVPNRERSSGLHRLIATIATNRLASVSVTDEIEDDLLRYVVAREGGADTRLLSRYASDAAIRRDRIPPGSDTTPSLLNFRGLPAAIRIAAMRGALELTP